MTKEPKKYPYPAKYNSAAYQHKIHLKHFPSPQQSVYAILDKDGNVIRIGSSIRTAYRLAQHLKYKTSPFAIKHPDMELGWVVIEDATGLSKIELEILEQHYIDIFKPEKNNKRAITVSRMDKHFKSLGYD